MQRRRMEILKYVRRGLRLQDFIGVPQYEPQVREMGRHPHKTFYSKLTSALRLLTRWKKIMNQIHPTSTIKPCFSKIPSSNVVSLFYVPNSLVTSPRLRLLCKGERGIFMSEHFAFPEPTIFPPVLHNEHGLHIRCSE
jgi:hypothetical protein